MRALGLALALLPVAALAQTSPTETPDRSLPVIEDSCGAIGFQGLVGQSAEIADLIELDQPLRVIAPDTMVTLEFRPDRINFVLDEEERIMRVECG